MTSQTPKRSLFETPHGKREIELTTQRMEETAERLRAVAFIILLSCFVGFGLAGVVTMAFGQVIEHQLDARDGLL